MQSLYAVCALALTALLALNLQRGQARDARTSARTEIEAVALATAEDGLDWAGTLPFDAQADAETVLDLTPGDAFGTDAGTFEAAADLDDLDGASRTGDVAIAEGTVSLTASADVRYVLMSVSGPLPAPIQTRLKEVTIRVQGPLGTEVTVSRMFPFRSGL